MATINIRPEEAITYGNQIKGTSENFKAQVSKIYSYVDDLKSAWTGTAASRFTDNIYSFKEDYEKFGQLINQFGDLLVAIGKDYQKLENEL